MMNKEVNINLNLYRSFYYVAKYGGFTKASQKELISQSALSMNIKSLEDGLDTKLFIRGGANATLTKSGEKLYLKLLDIINILNNDLDKKEINIGCSRFIADNYLISALTNYKKKYHDVKVSLDFSNSTELFHKLKKDELDIVICRNPLFFKFGDYISVDQLIDSKNVFCCSKKFYEINIDKFNCENYKYPLILPDSSEKRREIDKYLSNNNINYSVEFELPSSLLLKKLIIQDLGIGYININYILDDVKNNNVVVLNNFNDVPYDKISVIYNNKNSRNIVLSFIKFLKDDIRKFDN